MTIGDSVTEIDPVRTHPTPSRQAMLALLGGLVEPVMPR
jgi:hypothetical protein